MTVKDYFEITRPLNCLMVAVAVFIGGLLSGADNIKLFIASISAALITAAGNVVNDIFDIRVDRINKPYKPLAQGRIDVRIAQLYTITLFVLGNILAVFLTIYNVILALLNSFLLVLYSYKIKKFGHLLKNLTISYLVASTFLYGGLLGYNLNATILLSLLAFFSNTAREIVKDVEDIKGDEARTLPKILGINKSLLIADSFLVLAMLMSPLPVILGILSIYYFIPLSVTLGSFLLSMLVKDINKKKNLIKLGMLFGLLSFLFGIF